MVCEIELYGLSVVMKRRELVSSTHTNLCLYFILFLFLFLFFLVSLDEILFYPTVYCSHGGSFGTRPHHRQLKGPFQGIYGYTEMMKRIQG